MLGDDRNREYRASLAAVRGMLERARETGAVDAAELRARGADLVSVVRRQRHFASLGAFAALSEEVEALIAKLAPEQIREIVEEPTAVVVKRLAS